MKIQFRSFIRSQDYHPQDIFSTLQQDIENPGEIFQEEKIQNLITFKKYKHGIILENTRRVNNYIDKERY